MIYNNILEAIGHTPMIKLNRMNKPGNADVLVKFEGLNVGGSVKTRTAYRMIKKAEQAGKGNAGCAVHELRGSVLSVTIRLSAPQPDSGMER